MIVGSQKYIHSGWDGDVNIPLLVVTSAPHPIIASGSQREALRNDLARKMTVKIENAIKPRMPLW